METLTSRVKLHEGFALKPYFDTKNKLTIGYGRNLTDTGIFPFEADAMLSHDLYCASDALLSCSDLVKHINLSRRRVCVEMIFVLGLKGFKGFKKMIAAILNDDFGEAAAEMINSLWYEQAPKRVAYLAEIMRHGREIER